MLKSPLSLTNLIQFLNKSPSPFAFLLSKPNRKKNNTEIRGSYYVPVPRTYLDELLQDLGFHVLEISSGFLSLPADDWKELVKLVISFDLKAKPEVGIQCGAGGDASISRGRRSCLFFACFFEITNEDMI
ncbi:unnamed protein product [Adineta ricciae]|uniref:Uncharacterized protein n=1 Tax=Adineta ricciae TaxID=249248 RepID=A0A815K751_ADIRI|nr:unnamed protein product [Adineta ricciae]